MIEILMKASKQVGTKGSAASNAAATGGAGTEDTGADDTGTEETKTTETSAALEEEQDTATANVGESANPDIAAAGKAAEKGKQTVAEKKRKKELLEQSMAERGASPLSARRFVTPVNVEDEMFGQTAIKSGSTFGLPARQLAVIPRKALEQLGAGYKTSRGQLFAPKVSRAKVDEGIASLNKQIGELDQSKAEFDFLVDQLSSLRKIQKRRRTPGTELVVVPEEEFTSNFSVGRNTLDDDPEVNDAKIAQYQQQGLITDITDSTITFDGSKLSSEIGKIKRLIPPLQNDQKRLKLLNTVKQRLQGYVDEGIYGSEPEEE
jgi:hypothetical protein